MLNLFISESLPPDKSLVSSTASPVPTLLPKFVLGDAISTTITLVDGDGGISANSGAGELNVGIGIPGETPVTSETFIVSGTVWIGKLALNSAALVTLIGDLAVLNATLQIQLLDVNGQPQTIGMIPIKIMASVLPVALPSSALGLITGDDGNIYQLTAIVFDGVPSISPVIYGNQNITAPTSVTITGNDGNSYTYVVQIVDGIPTLVNQ